MSDCYKRDVTVNYSANPLDFLEPFEKHGNSIVSIGMATAIKNPKVLLRVGDAEYRDDAVMTVVRE
ncbi:hypothetical protein QUA36_08700 [Microcoleus sp. Pol10D4]